MINKKFLITLVSLSLYGMAAAQEGGYSSNINNQCIGDIRNAAAAIVARDWNSLERISERYIRNCKDLFGIEDESDAYQRISLANNELGNPKKAIASANACIIKFYANVGCHVQLANAFLALDRNVEAKVSLDRADNLITYRLVNLNRDLRNSSLSGNSDLIEAQISNLKSERSLILALRKNLNK